MRPSDSRRHVQLRTRLEPRRGSIFNPPTGRHDQKSVAAKKNIEFQDSAFAIAAMYDAVFLLNVGS